MAITDAEVTKYTNEYVRPISEGIRDLKHKIEDALDKWNSGVDVLIPNDAGETIEDGRESQGVSRLTGADAHLVKARMQALSDILNTGNAMDVINKAVVRPL